MEDKKESKSSFSLPVILLIAAVIAGGVFKLYAPMDSMRPPHESSREDILLTGENILSRMWQDPFQAVEKHEKRHTEMLPHEHTKCRLMINPEDNENAIDSLLVLPVLTTAGIYAEDIEKRLRSRYAVLSALHTAGYRAENASHIGVLDLDFGEIESGAETDKHYHQVPYEWFVLDPLKVEDQKYPTNNNHVDKVLVLWLGDEYFHEKGLETLSKLFCYVKAIITEEYKKAAIINKVLGPSSSAILEDLYLDTRNEISPIKTTAKLVEEKKRLKKKKEGLIKKKQELIEKKQKQIIENEINFVTQLEEELCSLGSALYYDADYDIGKVLILWLGDEYFHENRLVALSKIFIDGKAAITSKCNIAAINNKIFVSSSSVILEDPYLDTLNEISYIKTKVQLVEEKQELIEKKQQLMIENEINFVTQLEEKLRSLEKELHDAKGKVKEIKTEKNKLENEIAEIQATIDRFNNDEENFVIEMFSPWATADPFLLNYIKSQKVKEINSVQDIIKKRKEYDSKNKDQYSMITSGNVNVSLKQSIHTDLQLTDELVDELERRGVKVGSKGSDHIVLISEWDTSYGRALPLSFAISIEKYRQNHNPKSKNNILPWPERIHKMTYMRGIDGMLPDDNDSATKTVNSQQRNDKSSNMGYYTPEFKQPLGQAQFDYIRRLEDRIKQMPLLDHDGKMSEESCGGEIRAIGVLGSDIYDKLLILRALRGKFPNAIFFTNDLDARLFHETELPWTRNLIVASSYGLQLHPSLQKDIPPFRNVYQSSVFVATLQALGIKDDIDLDTISPRIFEIGRRGPYDLSHFPRDDGTYTLHPIRQSNTKKKELWLYIILMLILPLLLFILLIYHRIHDVENKDADQKLKLEEADKVFYNQNMKNSDAKKSKTSKKETKEVESQNDHIVNKNYRESTCKLEKTKKRLKVLWVLYFGVPCVVSFIVLTCFAIKDSWRGDGEPLTFFDSISIWPTVLIHLFCGFLAIYFILLSIQSLIRNNEKIKKLLSRRTLGKNLDQFSGYITIAWQKYHNNEGSVKKCVRIAGLFAIAYFGTVIVFFSIFGWPHIPFRGYPSYYTSACILVFSLLSMCFLAWFVINRVYYCRKFFSDIIDSETTWYESDVNCSIDNVINREECGKNDLECQAIISNCLVSYDKCLSDNIHEEWLKIRVIAARTELIGKMIMYSFVVFALLLVSRNQFFDCWTWTKPLIAAICLSICVGIYYAYVLFNTANTIRKQTINHLYKMRLRLMDTQIPTLFGIISDLHEKITKATKVTKKKQEDRIKQLTDEQRLIDDVKSKLIEQKIKYIECIIKDIQDLKNGAFTPLGRNPLLIAILAPLGGMGSIAILPHLIQLIGK